MTSVQLEFEFTKQIEDRKITAAGRLRFDENSPRISLMGESGSGKTSFARFLAGLTDASITGQLKFNGETWFHQKSLVSPQIRRVGLVSQQNLIFPHLNVSQNIIYGLRNMNEQSRSKRLRELLELIGLEKLKDRKIQHLSGGEKRRVALAQMLATHPRLLILDEAFTGLDKKTKLRLWEDTRDWFNTMKIPVLVITHDDTEAHFFADQIYDFDGVAISKRA